MRWSSSLLACEPCSRPAGIHRRSSLSTVASRHACISAITHHEPHCLHAHWLLFPGAPVVDLRPIASNVEHYDSFHEAYHAFEWPGQYLYSEAPAGDCWLAPAPRAVPRQLLRRVVARSLGVEAAADWQTHPGLETVDAARRRLERWL